MKQPDGKLKKSTSHLALLRTWTGDVEARHGERGQLEVPQRSHGRCSGGEDLKRDSHLGCTSTAIHEATVARTSENADGWGGSKDPPWNNL
eukprot:Skav222266  [mRNA]  locus=scaffold2459:44734:47135:+ [translate_table: standard]